MFFWKRRDASGTYVPARAEQAAAAQETRAPEPEPLRDAPPVAETAVQETERTQFMSSLQQSIQDLLSIDGATGAAIVDLASGMCLASGGNPGFNLDVAAAGNSNVIRAKLRTMADLDLHDEIEDLLITLGGQYHLINVMNEDSTKGLFVYLVLNRQQANLALARHKLNLVSRSVQL